MFMDDVQFDYEVHFDLCTREGGCGNVYCSPLGRVTPVCGPSPNLVKTFLCLHIVVFQSVFFMRVYFF